MSNLVLDAQNIEKSFTDGKSTVDVIKGISLQVKAGEFVSIVGSSGSGKSTLLHILGGLDRPSAGQVMVNGRRFDNLSEAERGYVRNENLGFVYQFHHLLPEFTALENVAMPLMLRKNVKFKEAKQQAEYLLERVGLTHRLTHQPGELSGGERQRVSIARALLKDARIVLLDEATSSLDVQNEHLVMRGMKTLSAERTIVVIAHRLHTIRDADQIVMMSPSGTVESIGNHEELMESSPRYRSFWGEKSDATSWKL